MASLVLECCFKTARWMPVVFIGAVIGWSYYAFIVQLLVRKLLYYLLPGIYSEFLYCPFHVFSMSSTTMISSISQRVFSFSDTVAHDSVALSGIV